MSILMPSQYQQLQNALEDAFDYNTLRIMLRSKLGKRLSSFSSLNDDLPTAVNRLIERAEQEGWLRDLILAAGEWVPRNDTLWMCYQQFGLLPTTPPKSQLESLIRDEHGFLDVETWRERMLTVERQVCRVEINHTKPLGTGLLVGADLLLTNYHVVEDIIEGSVSPQSVQFRFDYKQMSNGIVINPGVVCRLASHDWLIDKSPMSPVDDIRYPRKEEPFSDQLDYALLRLASKAGNEPIDAQNQQIRGWLTANDTPRTPYNFSPNTALLILQHPQGRPLQLALDTIIELNTNQTRVIYRTNTERGSSGSPCFSINWELVAIHHTGDYPPVGKPEYNEGVPFRAILALLKQRHLSEMLNY